jgi:prepilin-type N-terminal cleavage/methylation domain-containing protein
MGRRAGFTIVETVITLVLVGLLAGFAFIGVTRQIDSIKFNSAITRLVSDLKYWLTKANACANWSAVSFEVNPSNRYYLCSTLASHAITTNPVTGKPYIVELDSEYGVTITSVNVPYVEFSPSMIPYKDKATDTMLTYEVVVRLQSGTRSAEVHIQDYSGWIYVK